MTQSATTSQESTIRQKWMVLAVLCLPLLVLSLDNSVLNLALPPIAEDLGSSASELQWINDSYILVFASLLLTTGSIGDRYGRKRVLQVGLALFGVGSLAAALSNSTGMLIFFRGFLGAAGAMVMPLTLSIVVDTFRDPRERAQAVGIWASVFALGSGVGPLIGGALLDHFHWGMLFLINIPVVVITLGMAYFFIAESKSQDVPKPDIPGILLSTIGLFVLVYGIIDAGENGWDDPTVLSYMGGGILILALFAMVEKRVTQPMLPMGFFKNMSFTVASIAMVLTLFAMAGSLFLFSQYFQSVQGYSPMAAAIRLLPFALVMTVTAILSARIASKIGVKRAISLGILFIGAALLYLSQVSEVDSSYMTLVVGIVVVSVGLGMSSPPATDYIVGSLPVSRAGIASGVNTATRQLGMAIGVAVLGSLMNATYRDEIAEISVIKTLPQDAANAIHSSIQAAHITAGNLPSDIAGIIDKGANDAFVLGMNDAMFIGAFIVWATALFTFAFLPRNVQRHE